MAGAGYTAPLVTGEAQGGIGGTTKSPPPWRMRFVEGRNHKPDTIFSAFGENVYN
jgi:hypothetical protein